MNSQYATELSLKISGTKYKNDGSYGTFAFYWNSIHKTQQVQNVKRQKTFGDASWIFCILLFFWKSHSDFSNL